MMAEMIKTTCPYCGVGCGVLASMDGAGAVTIRGDEEHPANFGRLCSKGAALGETTSLDGRLLQPSVNGNEVDWNTALESVAASFSHIIEEYGSDAVAIYGSGQLLTEDYYVANKLMKGFIGSANMDTNSRLCMASSVAGHKRAFGSDTVPCSYEDLERAKLIVLVGSNAAWCHPVLYQRIVAAKLENTDLKVVVIDPRRTATCDIADLYLPLRPGSDAVLFNGLFTYLDEMDEGNPLYYENHTEGLELALAMAKSSSASMDEVAQVCGLSQDELLSFYKLFSRTERVITVYSQGINQSSSGTDKVNAIINCHLFTGRIGRTGMGPFSFTGQPNAMGGREVGGLSNQLAAHMGLANPEHRKIVQQFWQSPAMADRPGYRAVELFEAIEQGKVKAIWIMGTNPVVSMPDADQVKAALKKCEMVVVSEMFADTDTAKLANVLLPVLGWGEKDGTVTNSERRISRQKKFLAAPGEAKPDWWIISQVAQRMGFSDAFNYQSPVEIFREHAALSGVKNHGSRDFDISFYQDIHEQAYESFKPVQWPVVDGRGTKRLFANGEFFTPSKKARFYAVQPTQPKNRPSDDFPLVLNTGRVRDQWHTMTRTGRAPRLGEHSPEPYVAMHPLDAAEVSVEEGGLAKVFNRWGEVIVRVSIDAGMQRSMVFVPMHWSDQFSSCARVNSIVNPEVDPYSGQPELKHTPVRVSPYKPVWHGFILSRRKLTIKDASYWVCSTGDGFYRYEIAGDQTEKNLANWARRLLCSKSDEVSWVEYHDQSLHQYRGVRMTGKQVESCIFVSPSHDLPSRSWLASLFEKSDLDESDRKGLLLGRPPLGQADTGKVVCACFSVGVNTIIDAIETQNLNSVESVGKALKAGTNCGSCLPEIRELVSQATS